MKNEVDLQPQYICNVYSHLMMMAKIDIIDANSSQQLCTNAAIHAILEAMRQPPSELHFVLKPVFGWFGS